MEVKIFSLLFNYLQNGLISGQGHNATMFNDSMYLVTMLDRDQQHRHTYRVVK